MENFWINTLSWGIVIGGFALYLAMLNREKTTTVNIRFNYNGKLLLLRRTAANRKTLRVEQVKLQSFADSTDTGSYQIFYDSGNRYNPEKKLSVINEVELADSSLIARAQHNDFLNQFLHGNRLVLKHEDVNAEPDIMSASLLTREECYRIVAWLCGEF